METIYCNTAQPNAKWLCDWQAASFLFLFFSYSFINHMVSKHFFWSQETAFGKKPWGSMILFLLTQPHTRESKYLFLEWGDVAKFSLCIFVVEDKYNKQGMPGKQGQWWQQII